jgi:hypothetical protein
MPPRLVVAAFAVGTLALAANPRAALAIPSFARQYDVTCAKCHTVIPHLNDFGAAFMAYGYRIPGVSPGAAFPLSAKANVVDSSANQGGGPGGAGPPKAIVDEVEVFLSGGIGSRASYLVEQYAVDGGMPGLTRDAWVIDRVNPWSAKIPVYAQAGSFTLPLPVDPETFRDSYQGYALYEQTVGANPFTFFDPKIGVRVGVGDPLRGVQVQLFAGPGHDRQSGLPSAGTDTMAVLQDALGPLTLSAYRYDGTRPTGALLDRFNRTGVGITYGQWSRLSSETVLQTGWDSTCGIPAALGCASSGGFTQLRYQFDRRFYALGRYEGTKDPLAGFTRDGVIMLGYGPSERSRITIEDVIARTPVTTHTMNVQLTIAY